MAKPIRPVISSSLTTSKWVWWSFLLLGPVLGFLLLGVGRWALPIGLVVTAIPIFVTRRLLGTAWRTQRIVGFLFVFLAIAAIVLAFADPAIPSSLYIPVWLASALGFYFVAAPLLLASCVLFELHRVTLEI